MEFISDYGLFLAKAITVVVAILIIVSALVSAGQKGGSPRGHIEVTRINDLLDDMRMALQGAVLDGKALKAAQKAEKKQRKDQDKQVVEEEARKRLYVLDFDGDIKASATGELREAITAVLAIARSNDEVLVRLESAGGMVHSYGLAASQLARIREQGVPLTVSVDKVAASGGYMMACVADKILAAPFAIMGSIGVVAQLPNFHRLLKKNDVDFEVLTAGEYKRTLTMFGQNTDKGREKFVEDLETTHVLFKEFVSSHRPDLDIDQVATGEIWYGQRARDIKLVDELLTSDSYITQSANDADVFEVKYVRKKSLPEKFGMAAEGSLERLFTRLYSGLTRSRFFN